MSQLKDEVRLQYEKMHQILDEDLRKTMEILDKAQAKFCNENAAQVLHLNERMQEAKKLLSSVQVMFDKTEDINFMKVRTLCRGGRRPQTGFGGGEVRLTMRGWGHWSGGAANISSGFSGAQWDWCKEGTEGFGTQCPSWALPHLWLTQMGRVVGYSRTRWLYHLLVLCWLWCVHQEHGAIQECCGLVRLASVGCGGFLLP